jgi:hypothetical protein
MISIVEALDDAEIFGQWFSGASWALWRTVLKGAFCLPMSAAEVEAFGIVAGGRKPPRKRVRELWVIAGRRAGKDSIASALATYFATMHDYSGLLRPGERASIICLACDRVQAKIVLNYTRAYFERIEMLGDLVTRETADGLETSTGAEIVVQTNSFRAVRGRSIALAIGDEVAYWLSETSATPDVETYGAIVPGMATIPGAMFVGISSPYRRSGLLYDKWRESYGQDDDEVLVVKGASRTFNPLLTEEWEAREMKRDPARNRAEVLAEWRDDVAAFLPRDLIEAAVDPGVVVRPPMQTRLAYVAFCDPSGGVADSFCLSISHREGDKVILDCLVEIKAPFDPEGATTNLSNVLKSYGLNVVTGDKFAINWVSAAFERHGISYRFSAMDRSTIYVEALPLFTSGRARLLDNKALVSQLSNLERKTTVTGRDIINHPERSGHHDDAANAVCGSLVLAAQPSGELLITDELLAMAADPRWRVQHQAAPGAYQQRTGSFFTYPGVGR